MEITMDQYKPRSTARVNKIILDKGEQARIALLSQGPTLVFVHGFDKVVVDEYGKPIIKQEEWPDGTPREVIKTDYAGKFRCLGNEDVVSETGADPENCPACRAGLENSNAFKPAQARYLFKVLRYQTKPGSFHTSKPFSAQIQAWDLTEKRFQTIVNIWENHGDITRKDLFLGPCELKQMQKYDIQLGTDAEYLNNLEYVKELVAENSIEDLPAVAGKKPGLEEMRIKVAEIQRAYDHAFNPKGSSYQSIIGDNSSDPEDENPFKSSEKKTEETVEHINEETGEVTEEKAPAKAAGGEIDINDLLASLQ